MLLTERLVQGVDVWINTPRRPWEACGTSGMKVLVNGGLNLSELDGWWAEAYRAGVGWAIGDGPVPMSDDEESALLFGMLEREVVPEFYARDARGIPVAWVARIRASMRSLTWRFSSNRMLRDYLEGLYLPMLPLLHERTRDGGLRARELHRWQSSLERAWHTAHFGNVSTRDGAGQRHFTVQVYLGDLDPESVHVELYADPAGPDEPTVHVPMSRSGPIAGAVNAAIYEAVVPSDRPVTDFTPRIVPFHPLAGVPAESSLICWQR
jgi:starch phosphorylase